MEENPEQQVNNWRNPDGTLKPGHPPMGGRPNGTLDFKTKWYAMIDKLAQKNGVTPTDMEEQLLLMGFKKAQGGDFNFYRDVLDRLHGKPKESLNITGELGVIDPEAKKLADAAVADYLNGHKTDTN